MNPMDILDALLNRKKQKEQPLQVKKSSRRPALKVRQADPTVGHPSGGDEPYNPQETAGLFRQPQPALPNTPTQGVEIAHPQQRFEQTQPQVGVTSWNVDYLSGKTDEIRERLLKARLEADMQRFNALTKEQRAHELGYDSWESRWNNKRLPPVRAADMPNAKRRYVDFR